MQRCAIVAILAIRSDLLLESRCDLQIFKMAAMVAILDMRTETLVDMEAINVCVEVIWPSHPNGVMSSAVSLPHHSFTALSCEPVLYTLFRQKLTTALLKSAEGKMTIENIS